MCGTIASSCMALCLDHCTTFSKAQARHSEKKRDDYSNESHLGLHSVIKQKIEKVHENH